MIPRMIPPSGVAPVPGTARTRGYCEFRVSDQRPLVHRLRDVMRQHCGHSPGAPEFTAWHGRATREGACHLTVRILSPAVLPSCTVLLSKNLSVSTLRPAAAAVNGKIATCRNDMNDGNNMND